MILNLVTSHAKSKVKEIIPEFICCIHPCICTCLNLDGFVPPTSLMFIHACNRTMQFKHRIHLDRLLYCTPPAFEESKRYQPEKRRLNYRCRSLHIIVYRALQSSKYMPLLVLLHMNSLPASYPFLTLGLVSIHHGLFPLFRMCIETFQVRVV